MKLGREKGSGQRKRRNKISIKETENISLCSKQPARRGRVIRYYLVGLGGWLKNGSELFGGKDCTSSCWPFLPT